MTCPKCQTANREDRRFCRRCGSRLQHHCSRCGFWNELEDLYCGGCGNNLDLNASDSPPAVETAWKSSSPQSNPSQSFLAELLREEPGEAEAEQDDKKTVTQEEIDKLYNQ